MLKAGHHGSKTSSTAAFLERVRPQWFLVSVGERNVYRHPSQEVLDRAAGLGAAVLRTDRDGTISLACTPCACDRATWKKELLSVFLHEHDCGRMF